MSTVYQAPSLFSLNRGGFPEVVVHGLIGCQINDELKSSLSESEIAFPMRSVLKPWQFLATIGEPTDAVDLVGCASHSGQPLHIELLKNFAERYGVDLSALKCPASYPMDPHESTRLKSSGAAKQTNFHPCAGKHLAFLKASQGLGHITDYLSKSSVAHQRLTELIFATGVTEQFWVTDSCGLPTLATSMRNILKLWRNLSEVPGGQKLLRLWSQHPRNIGGEGRLDTWISEQTSGLLVAKEGADGILCVRDTEQHSPAVLVVKLGSGYHPPFLAVALQMAVQKYRLHLSEHWQKLSDALAYRIKTQLPSDQVLTPAAE